MDDDALKIIDWLLARKKNSAPEAPHSFADWKHLFVNNVSQWNSSADRAVMGGFFADRMAYAFAAGYECAIKRLIPALGDTEIVSFCVTESKGQHPKFIATKLEPISKETAHDKKWILNGTKLFATLACESDAFLIAVSAGTGADARNIIKMVKIEKDTPGLAIDKMDMHLVTEISHGILRLTNIEITEEQILPGDGFNDYIRPFRTIEDLHLYASLMGYLFRVSCVYHWPAGFMEQLLSVITCVRSLAALDPDSREVILAAEGAHRIIQHLIGLAEPFWQKTDDDSRNRWTRDKQLLNVAENIRVKRLEKAWSY